MEGVHYYKKLDNRPAESYSFSLGFDPVHVASNYHLPSEAAVVLCNGSLHLWDVESQTQTTWVNGDEEFSGKSDERQTWKTWYVDKKSKVK